MENRTNANKLISFPRFDSEGPTGPVACTSPVHHEGSAQGGRPTSLRYRGLHLMEQGATVKSVTRANGQAQADRIVAQIEWEIEQQAARQRERFANGPAAAPVAAQDVAAVAPIRMETPATVARRLFVALFSPARTA